MEASAFAAVLGLGWLFTTSGAAKLRAGRFTADLANYRLLPRSLVVPLGAVLPWAEVALGVALLTGVLPRLALVAGVVLLSAFTVGVVVNLTRGRRIACGCRGVSTPISWTLAATNIALVVAAVAALAVWPAPVLPTLFGGQTRLAAPDALAVVIALGIASLTVRLTRAWWAAASTLATVERQLPSGRPS